MSTKLAIAIAILCFTFLIFTADAQAQSMDGFFNNSHEYRHNDGSNADYFGGTNDSYDTYQQKEYEHYQNQCSYGYVDC